jgi:hypothetical protein
VVVVFGLFILSFETCVTGMDYVVCLMTHWHRASRLVESILGRWIVLLGIHMSALHFLLEVETGNFVVGVVWVWDTFSIRPSASRNNHTPLTFG